MIHPLTNHHILEWKHSKHCECCPKCPMSLWMLGLLQSVVRNVNSVWKGTESGLRQKSISLLHSMQCILVLPSERFIRANLDKKSNNSKGDESFCNWPPLCFLLFQNPDLINSVDSPHIHSHWVWIWALALYWIWIIVSRTHCAPPTK